jgi:hypothetical protein
MAKRNPMQFGLSTILWCVLLSAINFWLVTIGPWGVILAVVFDKHVLVAFLCWSARVDIRTRVGASELASGSRAEGLGERPAV